MSAINRLPLIDTGQSATDCCTLIDPEEWDEQTFVFDHKLFARARSRSFFHVPLNMGRVMKRAQEKIQDADATVNDPLTLTYETSPWYADHYIAVDHIVPDMDMENISGTFMTKVFEGPYKDVPKWQDQLVEYAKSKKKTPIATYFFYTVCPNCAKIYDKNYVVGFEQVG